MAEANLHDDLKLTSSSSSDSSSEMTRDSRLESSSDGKIFGYSMNPMNLCVKDLFSDDDGNEHL